MLNGLAADMVVQATAQGVGVVAYRGRRQHLLALEIDDPGLDPWIGDLLQADVLSDRLGGQAIGIEFRYRHRQFIAAHRLQDGFYLVVVRRGAVADLRRDYADVQLLLDACADCYAFGLGVE